eukprot:m.287001 g.287001  ORF g.287001 m.287001 type:complete len:342 (-) comp11685_c0_seq1:301-1326(-)
MSFACGTAAAPPMLSFVGGEEKPVAPGDLIELQTDMGPIVATQTSGLVDRYVRPRRGEPTVELSDEERWAVTLSGHKKGSNPRVKLDHGRLWCLRLPAGCTVSQQPGEMIDIFARPVGHPLCLRLQKYKRQPLPETVIFSLTDGSDKCHLRPALDCTDFNFVVALNLPSGETKWFVTTEAIHLRREASSTAQKRKMGRRENPDGADEPASFLEIPTMHTPAPFGAAMEMASPVPVPAPAPARMHGFAPAPVACGAAPMPFGMDFVDESALPFPDFAALENQHFDLGLPFGNFAAQEPAVSAMDLVNNFEDWGHATGFFPDELASAEANMGLGFGMGMFPQA